MQIRLFVAGRSYERVARIPEEIHLDDGATLDDALRELSGLLPDGQELPASCVLAVSGRHCGTIGSHRPEPLRDGDELVVLAPVAGG
jgi:molybdopterin converting factor small subunit